MEKEEDSSTSHKHQKYVYLSIENQPSKAQTPCTYINKK